MATPAACSSSAKRHAAAAAALLTLSLAGYGFLLGPGRAPYSPYSDFLALGLGAKTVLRDSLAAGHGLPFWRADQFSGNAALTDPQNAYLSPLNLPFWFWPALKAYGPTLWLYFLAAGVVGYLAAGMLGLGSWARLLVGAGLMFHFKLIAVAYAGWLPSFPGVIFCPLLLAAAYRVLEEPGLGPALAAAAAGALCVLSGHAQLLYYCGLVLAVLTALRRGIGAVWLAAAGVLAAGLSACVLLPLMHELPLLSRGRTDYSFFLSGHAFGWRQLITFFHPEALGTPVDGTYPARELWEDAAYFGLVPLLLAAAGAVLGRRRRAVSVLSAGIIMTLWLAWAGPWQRWLFDFLPGFHLFRIPGRFLFLTGWFAIALAGFGLEELLERLRIRCSAGALAAVAAAPLLLMAAEGSYYARRYLPMEPQGRLLPETDYQSFFASRPGPFRILPVRRSAINNGWAAPLGLELAGGYGSFNYRRYQSFCDLLRFGSLRPEGARVWTEFSRISRSDLLDALNARYLLSVGPQALPRDRFGPPVLFQDQPAFELYGGLTRRDVYVYENRRALSRAFFVAKEVGAADEEKAVAAAQVNDLTRTAVVEGFQGMASYRTEGNAVEVVGHRGGLLDLRVTAACAGLLVISEIWHPGWRARLDGADLAISPADIALMAVAVPAGAHRLVLTMRPPGWDLGLGLSALSVILLLLGLELCRRLSSADNHRLDETSRDT